VGKDSSGGPGVWENGRAQSVRSLLILANSVREEEAYAEPWTRESEGGRVETSENAIIS